MSDVAGVFGIAGVVIAIAVVILLAFWGKTWYDAIENTVPNSELKNKTKAIGEIQDKVDLWKSIMDWFSKIFEAIRIP